MPFGISFNKKKIQLIQPQVTLVLVPEWMCEWYHHHVIGYIDQVQENTK